MTRSLRKQILAIALMGGLVTAVGAEPAQAWPGWKEVRLGTLGTKDNADYWKAQKKLVSTVPPWNRNEICQWKFNRKDAKGRAASLVGLKNWDTECFYTYWSWW